MISMFAIVEINGCILNFAVKKPAIDVKQVVKMMHMISASSTRSGVGTPVKSKICPNTAPVLIPLCMIIVAVTMPMPTIRPIERSVPVRRISPATPRARNMRGDACCRMFRMLFIVNREVCLTIGVMIPSMMKIRTMTM